MSNEEAIYTLKNMAFLDVERDHEKTEEAIKTAISALEEIDRIKAERDAAVDDLEKCMYYARPKNNNVCNFCEKDMSEYPDKCNGWSGFCECEPKWKGVADDIEQEKA